MPQKCEVSGGPLNARSMTW